MPRKEMGVVKSEQGKGLVKVMMMITMMMIFCVYSIALGVQVMKFSVHHIYLLMLLLLSYLKYSF